MWPNSERCRCLDGKPTQTEQMERAEQFQPVFIQVLIRSRTVYLEGPNDMYCSVFSVEALNCFVSGSESTVEPATGAKHHHGRQHGNAVSKPSSGIQEDQLQPRVSSHCCTYQHHSLCVVCRLIHMNVVKSA